jgi:hypothetical protein
VAGEVGFAEFMVAVHCAFANGAGTCVLAKRLVFVERNSKKKDKFVEGVTDGPKAALNDVTTAHYPAAELSLQQLNHHETSFSFFPCFCLSLLLSA